MPSVCRYILSSGPTMKMDEHCSSKISHIRWGRTRKARPNLEKLNLHHNTRKNCYMNIGFVICGWRLIVFRQLHKILKVTTLGFHTGTAVDRFFGILLTSTTPDWGCLPRFPTKLPSKAVGRCGSAHYNSFIVYALRRSATFYFFAAREFLSVFPKQWMPRRGPEAWPAPSPI